MTDHREIMTAAQRLFADALVCDMVVPFHEGGTAGVELLKRFAASGHDFVSLTIAGDHESIGSATTRLASARALVKGNGAFKLVESVADITAAKAAGKLAVGLHLEGTNCLERRIELVQLYYDLGIRQCIPAFNLNNSVAGGCADTEDPGLSRFGRRVLDEMQRVGMIVDLSHTGHRSSMQAIERATAPVIFSHSNVDSIAPHYRNLRPDQIKGCAKTGGVIGVSGASIYLGDTAASSECLLAHIEALIEIAGPEHVALGTDYIANSTELMNYVTNHADEWPDMLGLPARVPKYSPPESRIEIAELMLRRGYSEVVIRGILGENFLRVCRNTWK